MAIETCYSDQDYAYWTTLQVGDLILLDKHVFVSWPPDGTRVLSDEGWRPRLEIEKLSPYTPMMVIDITRYDSEFSRISRLTFTLLAGQRLWWLARVKMT